MPRAWMQEVRNNWASYSPVCGLNSDYFKAIMINWFLIVISCFNFYWRDKAPYLSFRYNHFCNCWAYVEILAKCTCDKMNINLCLLGFLPFLPLSESLSGFSHYTLQTDRPISVCQTSLDQKLSCDNIAGFAKFSTYADSAAALDQKNEIKTKFSVG